MFVVNFDFSEEILPKKLFLINFPILITQFLTYPLQRLQTLLIFKKQMTTRNQFSQSSLIIRQMIGLEGFPRYFHGLRYSLDYSMTQMTTKFIVFDFLINEAREQTKYAIYLKCLIANCLGTILSQSAFNYQVVASSLPVNKQNRNENVKQKLRAYTMKKNVLTNGLKFTVPVSICNTILEVLIISKLKKIQQNKSYTFHQFFTAIITLLATTLPIHYAFQRQIQLSLDINNRIPFQKGLLGTFLRHNIKGITLYGLYYLYFEHKIKKQIDDQFHKKHIHQNVQSYRL